MALLDVDRSDRDDAGVGFTSYNRWNWAAFTTRDHIGDPRGRCASDCAQALVAPASNCRTDRFSCSRTCAMPATCSIRSPSIYCFDAAARLRRVLADVRNTYGGRRSYWLEPEAAWRRTFPRGRSPRRCTCPRSWPMTSTTSSLLTPPAESLVAHMNVRPRQAHRRRIRGAFDATLTLRRQPWTARPFAVRCCAFPLMTAKVIGGDLLGGPAAALEGAARVPRRRDEHRDGSHHRPLGRTRGARVAASRSAAAR